MKGIQLNVGLVNLNLENKKEREIIRFGRSNMLFHIFGKYSMLGILKDVASNVRAIIYFYF